MITNRINYSSESDDTNAGRTEMFFLSDCRQSPRLFAEDFSVLKRLKVSIFKTFQSLFGIIKVSKKAVLFYDDTRNRKSKKANADGMY